MDVFSDILKSVRLSGGVYFRCEFSAPWGMEIQRTEMAEFHVIVRGACWLRMKGRETPIALHGGDLLVFPHGDAHSLVDAPDGAALPAEDILESQNLDHYGPVTHGGAGLPATVLCGYFRFDRSNLHPLVTALPSLIHLRGSESHDFAWLQTTLNFMIHETRVANPGADAVVGRLAEVLFVQMVRAYFAQPDSPPGMLAGIGDARIGAALQLMHRSPEFAWTLESLARRAGMSRSAFATRFNRLVGQTPMHYLTAWRMQRARELLIDTRRSLAEVAELVGYHSESAFSKAFKAMVGSGPGAYRRREGAL